VNTFCRCYEGPVPCLPCREADAAGDPAPRQPWECGLCKHVHVGSCEAARFIREGTVLCIECGETCGCDIYGEPVPHTHMPGGDDRYPLCEPCQVRWLARHHPSHPELGPWLKTCDEGCVYDHVQATVPIGHGLGYKERSA